MNLILRRALYVLWPLLMASQRVNGADLSPGEAERIGQELAAELRGARPGGSSTNGGSLRLRDAKGRRREFPVTVVTLVGKDEWSISYQARFTNGASETLTARYRSVPPAGRS